MKGIMFRDDVWEAKMRVLEQYGEAQTRRNGGSLKEINLEPEKWKLDLMLDDSTACFLPKDSYVVFCKPRYKVGEIVYRKEAWYGDAPAPYKSPMMMAEKYARHFIQMTEVRAELVRDITPEDCIAEGVTKIQCDCGDCIDSTEVGAYQDLYDSINGKGRFMRDWCFAYTFKLVMRKCIWYLE